MGTCSLVKDRIPGGDRVRLVVGIQNFGIRRSSSAA